MDARQVWQAALERIQQRVSRGAYTTWFRGAVGVELSQRVLVVSVSNTFAAEHLTQRFADITRAAVSQALGAPADVRFVPAAALSRATGATSTPTTQPLTTRDDRSEQAIAPRRPTRPSRPRIEAAQSAALASP
ncbi:MAG TPA: DnaA N-terminal domain-containing protein, partial [Ktedonobacterales bacterium]|nr:DnaA N-terminal domain-containing protein [Ktedonobacterales bacterium]